MTTYVIKKSLNTEKFQKYISNAQNTNQWSNNGWAVKVLESRARDLLQIDDSKAVIATSNGTTALHAMLWGIQTQEGEKRVATQDFTFASNGIGPAEGPIVFDLDENLHPHLEDQYLNHSGIAIITNCFGHLNDIDRILSTLSNKIVIFDNAATPASTYKSKNAINYGTGSYVSLHHTKHIGFGEGGLAIIDKKYEEAVRIACNFGFVNHKHNERSGNYKMSEVSAAAILQWWDQFDLKRMKFILLDNYFSKRYELRNESGLFFPNETDDFLPSCYPFIHSEPTTAHDEIKKYYHPLRGMQNSQFVYDRILCYPITEGVEDCLIK